MSSLDIWTIYERPRDYPQGYVARRFEYDKPTNDVRVGFTLDEVRDLLPPGLSRIERAPTDDECIVEVWL